MKKIIDNIIKVLCTIIMGIMLIAVCWQVFTRFVLKDPSTVTEEMLRYLLVWTTMVGAAYAYGGRKHLSIGIVTKKMSEAGQKMLDICVQAVVIISCILIMMMGGSRLISTASDQISAALEIPMPYIYACLIVSAVLFIFYALIFVVEDIKALKSGTDDAGIERSE